MSNPAIVQIEFPSEMVDSEVMDICDRLEMMRRTPEGFEPFQVLWEYAGYGVIAALFRREYRDVINAFYSNPKMPGWEAISENGTDYHGVRAFCRNFSTDDRTGFVVADLEFDDLKLAAIIKLSARTPTNNHTF